MEKAGRRRIRNSVRGQAEKGKSFAGKNHRRTLLDYRPTGSRNLVAEKNSSLSYPERLTLANKEHPNISILRQAELLDISRSSIYYQSTVNPEDIQIMNAIDKIFTQYPFYGHQRIKPELKEEYGINIGKKRIISLMKEMGLNAIYPRPKLNLSDPDKQHKKFPYLLKGLPITRPNQVWGTDITYIKLKKYFAYLVAILDWYLRYVVAWKLSPTLENIFCIQALEQALKINTADIHNSDQGAQYTSLNYVNILEENEIRISIGRYPIYWTHSLTVIPC